MGTTYPHKHANEWPHCSKSGELRPKRRHSHFPRPCNNLRWKLVALLRPKIETRKFTLEVARFFMKKEMCAIRNWRGRCTWWFFLTVEDPFISTQSPRKWKLMWHITVGVLQQLQRHVQMKRAELKHQWILHHNNAQSHTTTIVDAWLTSKQIDVMRHPRHSPLSQFKNKFSLNLQKNFTQF